MNKKDALSYINIQNLIRINNNYNNNNHNDNNNNHKNLMNFQMFPIQILIQNANFQIFPFLLPELNINKINKYKLYLYFLK